MTYRELLNLYKNGKLTDEQKSQVEAELEKQEAISEFLFENDTIPDFGDTFMESVMQDDFDEKRFQNMIKKSIRSAFIKLGVTVAAVVLVIVLAANTTLPHIVDAFYYNPAKIIGTTESGSETNQISLDTMVYTELFTPGYYRANVVASSDGYGKYDIQILQSFSADGRFKNVFGSINKGKLTLFDDSIFKLPTANAFVSDEVGLSGTGASGSAENSFDSLNDLDEKDFCQAYVSLDKVMTYDEFATWSNESVIIPDWCAVCEKSDGYYAQEIIGFNYSTSSIEQYYDSEKYPYLNSFDISLTEQSSDVIQSHTTSMLRYMADNFEYCEMVGAPVNKEYLLHLADNIEQHGINIYGFTITAQKDVLIDMSKNENISYIHTTPLN